jgi:hypothetical protein
MPGLVPGIHVVTGHDGFRTSTFSAAAAGVGSLELALNVPAWMPGTSPIGAKLGRLLVAICVMRGLVPIGAKFRLSIGLSKPYPS